ncbi:hypothetical protein [Rhodoglobus sp.]
MSSRVRVYRVRSPEGFEWALPIDEAYFETLHTLEAGSQPSMISEVELKLSKTDDRGRREKRALMPWLGSNLLLLRDEAIDTVGPLLSGYGSVFPVKCREARLAVFGAPLLEGALDEVASEPARFSDGGIMYMPRPMFHPHVVEKAGAFRVAEMERGPVYFTGELVDAILATGQTSGTDFVLLDDHGDQP